MNRRHCGQFTTEIACPVCGEWVTPMLDLTASIENTEPVGRDVCGLQRTLDSIPADTPGRDTLVAGVGLTEKDGWPAVRIATILSENGLPVSPTSVREHRRGDCRCYRVRS